MREISHAQQAVAVRVLPFFGEALPRALARLRRALEAWMSDNRKRRRARETVEALMALDSRQLRDVGLSRSEILSAVYSPANERRIDIRLHD